MQYTLITLALVASALTTTPVTAQQSRHVPAYDRSQTQTVLNRSVFYLPLFGAVYKDKFSALVSIVALASLSIRTFIDFIM